MDTLIYIILPLEEDIGDIASWFDALKYFMEYFDRWHIYYGQVASWKRAGSYTMAHHADKTIPYALPQNALY